MSHLVLCPGCGYSFWSAERPEGGHGCWRFPPGHPDFHDFEKNYVLRWLVDGDAIEFTANPDVLAK